MAKNLHAVLSRRERQIMDIVYQLGRATAAEVGRALPERAAGETMEIVPVPLLPAA